MRNDIQRAAFFKHAAEKPWFHRFALVASLTGIGLTDLRELTDRRSMRMTAS